MIRNPYRSLERILNYRFRRRAHLETALTHRSYRYESRDLDIDNQRLEFLGDAALGLVVGAHLYRHYPEADKGDMTRVRSRLTNTKTLGRIAAGMDLGSFMRLGKGEQLSGGDRRLSTLADAFEAVVGAAYLDGGIKAVDRIFCKLFLPELTTAAAAAHWEDNPKGALQESCQRMWRVGPRYRTVSESGPPHARVFNVEALVSGRVMGCGDGPTKREAEMQAAQAALVAIDRGETPY